MALALAPEELVRALKRCGGNVAKLARALGVTDRVLRYALGRRGVSARRVRDLEADPYESPKPCPKRRTPRARRPYRRREKPLVRRLPVTACDVPRVRGPLGTGNGSKCTGAPGPFAIVEETERTIRNVAVDAEVRSVNAVREHWASRARRRARVHRIIREALGAPEWTPPELPAGWTWRVTFTRYSRLRLDDDNAIGAFKTHRDAVADVLGVNDRSPLIAFRVSQAKWNEPAMVRRFDRKAKRLVTKPGFRCFFRLRIEQVRGDPR